MITQGAKKLFLLDSYALIYRAYFAFIKNPRINSKGLDTSAIYGFINSLTELIREEKPTHLATVFDLKGPTFRHEQYPEYKANRDAMPEGISTAIPYIKKMLEALNIPQISLAGYEADDIIGTLSKYADKEGFQTYMITPDKDFGQLVTQNTFIYKPGTRFSGPKVMGEKEVCDRFGLNNIDQFIDFLGIMGDTSDNIPGVFGVGEKTAQKLITEYGSIEKVYEGIESIKGKLKEKLINSKQNAFLSKQLVTIATDAPIEFQLQNFKCKTPDFEQAEQLFQELEFNNIFKRIQNAFNVSQRQEPSRLDNNKLGTQIDLFSQQKEAKEKEKKVNFFSDKIKINDIHALEKLKHDLSTQKEISFCFSDNNENKKILCLSFDQQTTFLIQENNTDLNNDIIEGFLKDFFYSSAMKVSYDFKSQLKPFHALSEDNIYHNVFDIMLAAYIVNPDERIQQDILFKRFLDFDLQNDKENLENHENYLSNLVILNFQIKELLTEQLKANKLWELFKELEMPLIFILLKMEKSGFKIHEKTLLDFSKKIKSEIEEIQANIFDLSGKTFNISSPKQLGEVLFIDLHLDKNAKKTKTGQFSTSEQNLQRLKKAHPIINLVLQYRSLDKLSSTYVEALPNLINKKSNKIHTTFNQAVTGTGRLSSKEPNLQNIPIRTKYGREIRRAFIPSSDSNLLLSADYSQIELRLIAELSAEPTMTQAFLADQDIHSMTASKIFKVPFDSVTREMRSNAKTVNFGIIYGVSAFGLSQQTNLNRKESAQLISSYFEEYKSLKEYMNTKIAFAREHGYVETILGRRRYLKDINSRNALLISHAERNAINAPIQGSAADIIKKAMIDIEKMFLAQNIGSKMILQVHDELVFDVKKEEKEIVERIIKTKMEKAYNTKIPLKVELGFGKDWLEAH